MDIKEKYNAFIERVNRESTREHIPWFGKQVELEARKALDSESPPGMLVIDFVADRPGDFGDEMFNVMYGTEVELRCAVNKDNARTMRYKHAPREIDGVLYLAAVNPLVVHWEVNIGEMRPINPNAEPILTGKIKKEKTKMPEENKKTEYRPTLWYAVVHFGSKETDTSPCFLKRIPYTNADGNTENEYHHFTYGMNGAALFDSIYKADEARRAVEKKLSEEGHQLAGHVKVMQLFGLVRDSGSAE